MVLADHGPSAPRLGPPVAQPSRSLPSAASFSASVSPAIIAFKMRRPLGPKMSVITEDSLMFASSRTAWMRWTCCTISRVNCLRVRVSSRNSWIGSRRHKACPDQAMRQQVGEPSRVINVTLAARYVLHMHGIRQDERKTPFQDVPDRLPVHARRFHRHVRASCTLQPLGKRQ